MTRFGISIPQVMAEPRADVAELHRYLARVEDLGFDSVWVQEQPIGDARTLDPLALLAHAAAVTTRVRLGTAVILLPLRIPVELAKSLASIDQLSRGRLIAGVALGRREHYPAFGLTPDARVRRFEEAAALLKRLWTEPSVTAAGGFWQLDGVAIAPKPVQQPHPPLWFGAGAPAALERTARLADGWIGAGSSSSDAFAENATRMREALGAVGRDAEAFPIAKRVYVAVDDDVARARSRLRDWFGGYYGSADLADRVAVAGPTAAVAEELARLVHAGAQHVILNPVFDDERHAETLAAEVIPALRDLGD